MSYPEDARQQGNGSTSRYPYNRNEFMAPFDGRAEYQRPVERRAGSYPIYGGPYEMDRPVDRRYGSYPGDTRAYSNARAMYPVEGEPTQGEDSAEDSPRSSEPAKPEGSEHEDCTSIPESHVSKSSGGSKPWDPETAPPPAPPLQLTEAITGDDRQLDRVRDVISQRPGDERFREDLISQRHGDETAEIMVLERRVEELENELVHVRTRLAEVKARHYGSLPKNHSGGGGYPGVGGSRPGRVGRSSEVLFGEERANRSATVVGITSATTHRDLCRLGNAFGGAIESVDLQEHESVGLIRFVNPLDAEKFLSKFQHVPCVVDGNPLRVVPGPDPPYSPELESALLSGATRNLYIGGVSREVTETMLRAEFGKYGFLESCLLHYDKRYAFVNMTSIQSAIIAMRALQGQLMMGTRIRINFAKEKPPSVSMQRTGMYPHRDTHDADVRPSWQHPQSGFGGSPSGAALPHHLPARQQQRGDMLGMFDPRW